ncbi:hypothetical protein HGG72_09410 [Ochrobactrum pecoris]|uniref:DUF7666 domain-containing protein n=1 Tax=Brucella pecoris TaxID=867683 RepID=A0A5C5CSN7_9HYPH|nr:hypothetical protein [Brucella pecoris]MBB4092648.1 hypothetical protein [Brucella pecoris]NKW80513.1 hypothetical protein [Brucella pecoris]TNV14469.1 hypothetical protein FIB18_04360 [Brucella pecoris]
MTKIVAYKGFDAELRCRGYQFELSKSFQHQGGVVACESGFHACEYPLDVFGYHPPASSRYGEVELSGDTSKEGKDTKIAAAEITIKAELKIPELIAAAVRYIVDRAKRIDGHHASGERELIEVQGDRAIATVSGHWSAATASGDRSAATATGRWSAATATGYWSAATASGDQSAATASGDWSAATATGYQSAATATGDRSAATASGDRSAATATGYRSAATATGYWSAATASGRWSAATATGSWSAATASGIQSAATASGDWSAATASGRWSAATATGYQGKVRGKEGCALFLVERNDQMEIIAVWAGVAGQNDIKPDTFYILQNGQPVETE